MRIYGIDFTSAPRRAKPIVCATCDLSGETLSVVELQTWTNFDSFEQFLASPGRWVAAVDLPLGQPLRLVEALGWPLSWQRYVEHVGRMSKAEFVETIDNYRSQQPPGDKHHPRATDTLTGACSPMMLYGVPVGKMFYEGAPRVAASPASVVPCRPTDDPRTVVEGYPGVVARRLVGRQPYKNDKRPDPQHELTRKQILRECEGGGVLAEYGVRLRVPGPIREDLIADTTGDRLDAVFCGVQAAWWHSTGRRTPPDGIASATEGVIADPLCWYSKPN
ncbi:MAG: DUF429 domain-containing protein [Planctomycetota bacterium]